MHPYFIFRLPETIDELKALLHLRYNVYRESRLKNFIRENQTELDIDCYDLNSLHFGLFLCGDNVSSPVGYVRLVTDEPGPFYRELIDIAAEDIILREKTLTIPDNPFPVMNYTPYTEAIRSAYQNAIGKNKRMVETGRLSLDKSVRNLETIIFMIHSAFAVTKTHSIDQAVHSCTASHHRMYERFGFEIFPGTGKWFCPYARETGDWFLLLGVHEKLPTLVKGKTLDMAIEYEQTGRICSITTKILKSVNDANLSFSLNTIAA